MGNLNSNPVQNINIIEPVKTEEKIIIDEDDIFVKILDISNNLLMEYNNEFLSEDFCNKIAIVYQKKLTNFSIKLLKNLNNDITSQEINNELLMTLQYNPNPDEKFFVDIFNDPLNENFWGKTVAFDNKILINNSNSVDVENLIKERKIMLPRYIDKNHVNNLLSAIPDKNNIKNISGGGNNKEQNQSQQYYKNSNNGKNSYKKLIEHFENNNKHGEHNEHNEHSEHSEHNEHNEHNENNDDCDSSDSSNSSEEDNGDIDFNTLNDLEVIDFDS